MKKLKVIKALWEDFHYCEFCSNPNQKETYHPFTPDTANPMHICEKCVESNEYYKCIIVGKIDDRNEYRRKLLELKE